MRFPRLESHAARRPGLTLGRHSPVEPRQASWLWLPVLGFLAACWPLGHAQRDAPNYTVWQETLDSETASAASDLYRSSASLGEIISGRSSSSSYASEIGNPVNHPGSPPLPGSELVINGSFENIAGTFAADGNGVMSIGPGKTTIPGWTTVEAELIWGANDNAFGPASPYGHFLVDLTGYHDSPPYGGLTQIISTSPNQTYRISFSLGARQDNPLYRGPMSIRVTAGSSSNMFTFEATGDANQWGTFTLDFTAEAENTPLTFVGTFSGGGAFLGLDNVSALPLGPRVSIVSAEKVGNELRFTFATVAGIRYAVQSRGGWTSEGWETLADSTIVATGRSVRVVLAIPVAEAHRFFRVLTLP